MNISNDKILLSGFGKYIRIARRQILRAGGAVACRFPRIRLQFGVAEYYIIHFINARLDLFRSSLLFYYFPA